MLRKDFNDQILELKEKYNAITNKIIECNTKGQPVLVGTHRKIRKDFDFLKNRKIKHNVLNAKQHEQGKNNC